jgi:septal ring factor EnvC (AmiA/AmiB activator)
VLNFSQSTSQKNFNVNDLKNGILVIQDTSGITYMGFENDLYVSAIIKDLKNRDIDRKVIRELEKKLKENREYIEKQKTFNDSLNSQIDLAYKIIVSKNNEIEQLKLSNDELHKAIDIQNKMSENKDKQILKLEKKVERKSKFIRVLLSTNVVTLGLLVLIII